MVDKWDGFTDDSGKVPIQPVNGAQTGKTIVKFIGSEPEPPATLPAAGDARAAAILLFIVIVVSWLFGVLMQAQWHFI
jgi:hypothetical protein